jgi:hypothetical protein
LGQSPLVIGAVSELARGDLVGLWIPGNAVGRVAGDLLGAVGRQIGSAIRGSSGHLLPAVGVGWLGLSGWLPRRLVT